jgi:RES domain-containing protein
MQGPIEAIVAPFSETVAVAIKGDANWDAADLITNDGNRWSRPGEPTIYLASDPAVALAEFARHVASAEPHPVASLWAVDVRLSSVADVRRDSVREALGLPAESTWALDVERCRMLGTDLRRTGACALIAPSVAFLDRPERWNLVIFAESLGDQLDYALRSPGRVASLA